MQLRHTLVAAIVVALATPALAGSVAHWRFEEAGFADGTAVPTTSGQLLDSSGNGHHGTAQNSALTYESGPGDLFGATVPLTGAFNTQALGINGIGRFDAPGISLGAGGAGWTIEMFIYVPSPSTIHDLVTTITPTAALENNARALHISDTRIRFDQANGTRTSSPGVPLDAWSHIAIVYTGVGDDRYRYYVNGAAKGTSGALAAGFGGVEFDGITVGRTDEAFFGWIDEVRLSNTALGPGSLLVTPEPHTSSLLALGLLGLATRARRRRTLRPRADRRSSRLVTSECQRTADAR